MVQLLFIPYQQENTSSDDGTDDEPCLSWQKHASREYHRRNKLQKAVSARQARSKLHPPRGSLKSNTRLLIPRGNDRRDLDTAPYSQEQLQSVLSNVGGGLFDPFGMAIPSDKPRYAIEMLNHAISRQWPAFDAGSGASPIKQTILSCAMLSPACFHAVVFAAASHAAFNYTGLAVPNENRMLRMSYKGLAISHLKQEIADLRGPAPEELLLGVITLAAHGYGDLIVPPPNYESKLKGPLADAQHSQFYGEIRWEPAHLIALVTLIEARGGLRTLKLPGLAESIKLSDNLEAFKGLRRPVFDLLTPIDKVMSKWPWVRYEWDPSLITTSPSSRHIAKMGHYPQRATSHPLLKAIRYIPTVLAGYRDFLDHKRDCPSLVQLLSARNCVLHELLLHEPNLNFRELTCSPCSCFSHSSICRCQGQTEPSDMLTSDEHRILSLIRLIALAFTLLVLFPLPRVTGVHDLLATEIMQAIERCYNNIHNEGHTDLLLYATMVGGAVADKFSRPYFVNKVLYWESTCFAGQDTEIELATRSGDELWAYVKSICVSWLWYDGPYSELEIEAVSFWTEVLRQRDEIPLST